jgi:PTH1 family peptidyl-tRNA hydrolase
MPAESPSSALRLVVGLGNPGRDYAGTRHNAGFMVLDRLAQGGAFRIERAWKCELARVGDLLLCKPLTFMNLSGEAVRAVSDFYRIAPAEMLVISDDMALPLGKLRLRAGGSAGGHNGLKSIAEHLGTQAVPRLRIGIGGADPGESVGHVLGKFAPAERAAFEDALILATQAVETVRERGLAAAMNTFNQTNP